MKKVLRSYKMDKQIEEMIKTIAECNKESCEDCKLICTYYSAIKIFWEKLTENAVVLTYDELQNIKNARYCTGFINGKEDGIKETVEKIFEELYDWLNLEEIEKYGFVHIQKFDFLQKFRNVYKKLCNDEIANEMMEKRNDSNNENN